MGQYYYPTMIKKNGKPEVFYSWDYGENGSKLMEHAYVGNKFTESVVSDLYHSPSKLVWFGDYTLHTDKIPDILIFIGVQGLFSSEPTPFTQRYTQVIPTNRFTNDMIFVNHTKEEYFDMGEFIKKYLKENKEKGELLIHPIPLLAASSNGRGGGDYKGINMNMVGYWCGEVLEVIDKEELNTIKGYTNIIKDVYFEETYN